MTPAPPRPWMARVMIKAILLGERAAMRLPSSKTAMHDRKTILSGKYLYALPQKA